MLTPETRLFDGLQIQPFRHFRVATLSFESAVLRGNPLGDPTLRAHPLLVPAAAPPKGGYPVVFVLAGFTGNGPGYFGLKTFEQNFPATIDACRVRGEAPEAVYLFVDAMTSWGGSQFVNSEGTGRYEDYVALELPLALRAAVQGLSTDPARWCVFGGSSGGYGALHLTSSHPSVFGTSVAIAPDSFFEASLLPGIWSALPTLQKLGGPRGVRNELLQGRFLKRKEAHHVLNAVAMGLCYAPKGEGIDWPVNESTGTLKEDVWRKWKAHDPIEFLRAREDAVQKVSGIFVDVGTRDQYHLQYGSRQIRGVLEDLGADMTYSEFEGDHSDIGERRPDALRWLSSIWRS